jgi:acetolactate synthase-1/2/3 large subunit
MQIMNLAEYLAVFLKLNGVNHIFGLPGGENVLFIEALRRTGLEFILCSHEASAGFAADVTGQLTGRPGVCLSTVGPGAANLLAAAAAATLERSPVLAITADIDSNWKGHVQHMVIDQTRLFSVATKGSFGLKPKNVASQLSEAWQLALTPPAGAVHLSLSPDVAGATVTGEPNSVAQKEVPAPTADAVAQLKPYLSQAREVILLAGLGVEAAGAQQELRALAEKWEAIVAVTPKAKGAFPENHPLYAGCFSTYGDTPLRQAIDKTDLVIGVGLDSVDFVTSTWDFETTVVSLNLAQAEDPALNPAVAINGDLRTMLQQLTNSERFDQPKYDGITRAENLRQEISRQLFPSDRGPGDGNSIEISNLIDALQQALPEEAAVTVDVGAFKLVLLQRWRAIHAKSIFVANGLSAMGYAIPGALAIRLAQPQRPVVAVVGDGALLMYIGELATVARVGQPLIILVVVDQALSLIRLKQLRQDVPIYGTELNPVNYAKLAEAFNLEYRLINGHADPGEILEDVLDQPGPVVVEARISNREYDRYR